MDNDDEPRRKLVADIAKVRAELEEAKALHSTGAQRKIWFLEENLSTLARLIHDFRGMTTGTFRGCARARAAAAGFFAADRI